MVKWKCPTRRWAGFSDGPDVRPHAGLDIKIMLTLGVYGWPFLDLGSPCRPFLRGKKLGHYAPLCLFFLRFAFWVG